MLARRIVSYRVAISKQPNKLASDLGLLIRNTSDKGINRHANSIFNYILNLYDNTDYFF